MGYLFCSFVFLGKQGKRRRCSALATMATWWIFGKWYLGDATKCFQATSSEPQLCPSWEGHHPHPDPHRLSAHALCKGERRHSLQGVWWRCGLQFLLAGPPPTHACRPCSDHPTASPGSAWSMNWTPQGSSWWIWGQTRLPVTTHSMAATTLCSSASQRPRASCPPTQLPSSTWCRKGGWQEGMLRAEQQNLQDPNFSEPWLPSFRGDRGHITLGDDGTN